MYNAASRRRKKKDILLAKKEENKMGDPGIVPGIQRPLDKLSDTVVFIFHKDCIENCCIFMLILVFLLIFF